MAMLGITAHSACALGRNSSKLSCNRALHSSSYIRKLQHDIHTSNVTKWQNGFMPHNTRLVRANSYASQRVQKIVDLRSDTVTVPSAEMRKRIAQAAVGDDVLGEDPTTNRLEKFAADLLGFEAALFVPSGTMGNLIAIGSHCQRGDEIITGEESHIHQYEGGGCSGVTQKVVANNKDGSLPLDKIRSAIRADDPHYPRSSLIALENTQNRCGGKVLKPEYIRSVAGICKQHSLSLHVDGARLMNAAVVLGVAPSALLQDVDSVSLCLSKGLGAPVGSVIAGTNELIYKARRMRKSLGGGTRQSGILAAAGLYALENNVDRLAQDHKNAKKIANALSAMNGVILSPTDVQTNIIYFTLAPNINEELLLQQLRIAGVLVGGGYDGGRIRMVTNLNVSEEDAEFAIESFSKALAAVEHK